VVDQIVDEAINEDHVQIANNQNLTESQTKEVQAGLNLIAATFPDDNAEQLKVDGVFGPKTYARFKQFYVNLPESTKKRLPPTENPVANIDGKVV
tara:strand:+ start:427 stop:711 length:285 start_codon:yes stop_codon:yes gene_type:complete